MAATVVAFRTDLLGGRLLNLMHGWRLARRLDAELVHIWPLFQKWRDQSGYVDDSLPMSQVFNIAEHMLTRPDLRFVTVDGVAVRYLHKARERRMRMLPAMPDGDEAYRAPPTAADLPTHWPVAGFDAVTPFPLAGDARAAAHAEARALIRALPLNADLSRALKAARAALRPADFVAVHLRRGDIVRVLLDDADKDDEFLRRRAAVLLSRYAPDAAFQQALSEHAGSRALLFSDSAEAVAGFQAEWPEAVDAGAVLKPLAAEHGLSSLQADALELLVMSEAAGVLGSGSNYAGFAMAYGGGLSEDVRGRWTRDLADEVTTSLFAQTPERVRSAVAKAFDDWFAAGSI